MSAARATKAIARPRESPGVAAAAGLRAPPREKAEQHAQRVKHLVEHDGSSRTAQAQPGARRRRS